ncbi:MAG TPA: HAMP domain-containing sensor histidine kinase [Polyangia bacterium]|jgi:signal transduction histidine kinase|nr:HAMP domain-containing sensor histidine kinase [Polyangia bacterium]
MRTRRLYVQLYLVMLISTLGCLLVAGLAFRFLHDKGGPPARRLGHAAAALAEAPLDLDQPETPAHIAALADELSVDIVAVDAAGRRVASPADRPFPVPTSLVPGWRRGPGGPLLTVSLGGDGWALLRARRPQRGLPIQPFSAALLALAVVMAIASYPVARRMTRRLEQLAGGVERWGSGQLGSRVAVEGRDEVATLAETFNRAAERIDLLFDQQRQVLANTSHELRSPLARLRMAIELVLETTDPEQRRRLCDEIRNDVVELDAMIEELLLFARADSRDVRRPFQRVALTALMAAEAKRTGAAVSGPDVEMDGDPDLIRHLLRNLLENALSHGLGRDVRASVTRAGREAIIAVEDSGPGILPEDHERIFAPFYRRPVAGAATPRGHGLGLALVRQVARYHGGDVRYVARADGGSRFEVTLPLWTDRPASS